MQRLQAWIEPWLAYRCIALLAVLSAGILGWQRLWDLPIREYSHRLVGYEHGFTRRALVGEIYSIFVDRVPVLAVNIEGLAAVAICAILAVALFLRLFPVASLQRMALACFVFGSPFLLKNLLGNNAKFDVFGAIVLLLAALVPLRPHTMVMIWIGCAALLLLHHVNATLFIPAIHAVIVLRRIGRGDTSLATLVPVIISLGLLAVLAIFVATRAMPIAPEQLLASMQMRATVSLPSDQYQMWFMTLREEVTWTWSLMPGLLLRLPVYLLIVALHWPAIASFHRWLRVAAAANPVMGRWFAFAAAMVSGAYIVTALIIFDHARLAGDFAVCLCVLTAVQCLTVTGVQRDLSDVPAENWRTMALAALVAAMPWVGTIYPLI